MRTDQRESHEAQTAGYESPRIELLGDLNDLTQQMVAGSMADAGGFMNMGVSPP